MLFNRGEHPVNSSGFESLTKVTNIKRIHGEKLEIGTVSEELLEKYNRPGPRYTSYPTAPAWKDDFGPADLEQSYSRANALATPLSLYMHLPFCESLCLFCACNVSIQKDKSVAIPYLAALKQEI
jgi:oxygen-independent coproporphyrinogen III oxidase